MQTTRFIFTTLALLIASMLLLPGCGVYDTVTTLGKQPSGDLTIMPRLGDQPGIEADFDHATYTFDDKDTVTAVLFDGDPQNPTRAAVVRMFWQPAAGRTPIDSHATNATLHYIDFTDDQVAVYSGAGFVYPNQKPGNRTLTLGVWDADLRLMNATDGYTDALGQAMMRGKITVRHDAPATDSALRMINQQLRAELGYVRLVQAKVRQNAEPL